MRRPGERHLRDGVVKDKAVARQAVQRRRLNLGRAVATHVVGANRVDGNQNHIRRRPGGGNCCRQATREQDCLDRQELESVLQ